MSKATLDTLDALHGQLANALADEIKNMTKTGADRKGLAALMNVARQFLKDNNVEALMVPGSPIAGLADSLPYPGGDSDLPPEDYSTH